MPPLQASFLLRMLRRDAVCKSTYQIDPFSINRRRSTKLFAPLQLRRHRQISIHLICSSARRFYVYAAAAMLRDIVVPCKSSDVVPLEFD